MNIDAMTRAQLRRDHSEAPEYWLGDAKERALEQAASEIAAALRAGQTIRVRNKFGVDIDIDCSVMAEEIDVAKLIAASQNTLTGGQQAHAIRLMNEVLDEAAKAAGEFFADCLLAYRKHHGE